MPSKTNTADVDKRQVIDSMRRIGNSMPACLKETGTGGLAVTESANKYLEK